MLKNLSQLTHTMAGKAYTFVCDVDSTLDSIKEALFQFQKYIGQIEDQVKAQKEAMEAAPTPPVVEAPQPPIESPE